MTKNLKTIFILSTLMFGWLIGVNNSNAATLAATLKGKILLQVEQNGEAWYVNPTNVLRYYLGRPVDAFNVMRELGLGISNGDFDSFNGYAPSRLSGRILLKVADSGKAYYVNTNDLKMYYLGRPADAFNVMRELGLGITDKNLNLIGVANNKYTNQQYGFEFQYPSSWPQPTMVGGFSSGGFPDEKSKWTLNIGIVSKGPCEGADCAQYKLEGFSVLNYSSALALLQKDEFTISEVKEINMNGLKVITYIENGLRADQAALIFGSTQTLKLVDVWGEKKYFDQIISTFKFTSSINGLFEGAVNKSDFSTASKYFADNVYVVLEGSSCCGEVTTSRAKQELERINGMTFTFNPNDAVVKEYMAYIASQYPNRRLIKNSPTLYFDEYTIGVESDVSQNNKAAIGYKVSNNKITDLFINVGRDR